MLFSSCQALKKQHIVEINEVDQEVLLNRATLNCFILLQSSPNGITLFASGISKSLQYQISNELNYI